MAALTTLLRAEFVAPIDAPLLSDGAILIADGRILAIGPARAILRDHPGSEQLDLGRSLIMPGLVNPHVHLELSTCQTAGAPVESFADWILGLRQRMRPNGEDLHDVVTRAVSVGLEQCRRFGVTTVGDISQHNHITRPLLRNATIRCVSFGEALGLAKLRARFDEQLVRAIDPTQSSERLRIGLSPHAPYTVDINGYRQCLVIARERGLPVATHLAETPDERAFLEDHQGPFRRIFDTLGLWQDGVPTFDGGPIEFAHAVGLLEYPALLAHVNYCDDAELDLLAGGGASVVYCPRTHRNFNHPPHRWRDMLARGINVAIGTDSCASSPDLNILDDLRLLRTIAPDIPAQAIWELVTIRAARALGMEDEVGSLIPHKRADLTIFSDCGPDPLEAVLREQQLPAATWLDGSEIT